MDIYNAPSRPAATSTKQYSPTMAFLLSPASPWVAKTQAVSFAYR